MGGVLPNRASPVWIAVKLWGRRSDARVELRSDNRGALVRPQLMATNSTMNAMTAELALELALGARIESALHVPGVANVAADHLSRFWAPKRPAAPPALDRVPRIEAPRRDGAVWRSIR